MYTSLMEIMSGLKPPGSLMIVTYLPRVGLTLQFIDKDPLGWIGVEVLEYV